MFGPTMRESITVNSSSNNGAERLTPQTLTMQGFGGVKVKLCEIERPVTIDPLFQLLWCQPLIRDLFKSHRKALKSASAMVSLQPLRGRQISHHRRRAFGYEVQAHRVSENRGLTGPRPFSSPSSPGANTMVGR